MTYIIRWYCVCLYVQEVDNLLLELAATYRLVDDRTMSFFTRVIDVRARLAL